MILVAIVILGILLFLVVAVFSYYESKYRKISPSSIKYDMRSHKAVYDTKYSHTRNPADFDPVLDKDKIGDPAYPNAGHDAVAKDWDEYRKMRNAALDPFDDEDRAKWLHPEI
jgi:hypothetical protein